MRPPTSTAALAASCSRAALASPKALSPRWARYNSTDSPAAPPPQASSTSPYRRPIKLYIPLQPLVTPPPPPNPPPPPSNDSAGFPTAADLQDLDKLRNMLEKLGGSQSGLFGRSQSQGNDKTKFQRAEKPSNPQPTAPDRAEPMRKARALQAEEDGEEQEQEENWATAGRMTWLDWAVVSCIIWGAIMWMSGRELWEEVERKRRGRLDEALERERERERARKTVAEEAGEGWRAEGEREERARDGWSGGQSWAR
ncbi:hypothetical protein CALCODRAFT_491496 [Calocera cornea HHB12733]|uniref:Uncharacterized protein n=1 Tax=Calocera cornea HHB12733 TaxID=1353952 RepID=A0A165IY21_9BASI|nr:hypothetical protein CALCODRAFT_491496 [Calocera cornea HHB12733]